MKKLLLFFLIISSFLFSPKIKSVSAQSCNCKSQGPICDVDPCLQVGNYHYECVPTNANQCGSGKICQCGPLNQNVPITNCTGTCINTPTTQCTDVGGYCTYKCGFFSQVRAATCPDDTQVCCSITGEATNSTPACIQDCSTNCVFGINLPGFTCQVEPRGRINTCACHPPSVSPGQPIPTLNPWGKCGTNVAIDTAIGCIPVDPSLFVQTFITLIIGLAGVIAFLLMVFAAIKIILAGGNPEKLQAGKEMLTSAIIGLILIIFSTVILELIGVHILQIPGFLEFK